MLLFIVVYKFLKPTLNTCTQHRIRQMVTAHEVINTVEYIYVWQSQTSWLHVYRCSCLCWNNVYTVSVCVYGECFIMSFIVHLRFSVCKGQFPITYFLSFQRGKWSSLYSLVLSNKLIHGDSTSFGAKNHFLK